MPALEQVVNAAREAAEAGRWGEAERLWTCVLERDPANRQALFALTVQVSRRGDLTRAVALAEETCRAAPADPFAWLALARLRSTVGDSPGEMAAIESALSIDPYCASGVLAKAAWMERNGLHSEAIRLYWAALKIAPPDSLLPAPLRSELESARRKCEAHGEAFSNHLAAALAPALAALSRPEAERWREAIAIRSGLAAPSLSQSNQFTVPRLPAIPFFEPELFAWAAAIEEKTDIIAAEFSSLLENGTAAGITPYIAYRPGEPMNQFAPLNQSPAWSAFQLYRHGERVEENCARVPETMRALGAVELMRAPGCPNVMFSLLAPHTRIPPHQGETNARVIAHLPLIVPDGCLYRVGFEKRRWRRGELLVFDDTIEHEARNDSDEVRVVLIFDLWNPLLSAHEREIACALLAASNPSQA